MKVLLGCSLLLGVACGRSEVTTDAAPPIDAMDIDASVVDSGSVHVVPDPGTMRMQFAWPDTEPNDTPEQAVPLGVGSGGQIGPYIGPMGGGSTLGGGDNADYFVFRTAPVAGATFIANVCWDDTLNVNLLDLALYKVVDGQPLIPVMSSTSSNIKCEMQVPFNIDLAPDTKYLFALIHVEGAATYHA
jgi:hypothetical protein